MQPARIKAASMASVMILAASVCTAQETTRSRATESPASHQMLSRRVNTVLAGSGALAGTDIKITVRGDVVTLTGLVADNDARERAVALVRRMRGVEKVVDNLRMNPALAGARVIIPDPELAQAVAQRLSREFFPGSRATQESKYTWEVDGGAWDLEITADDGDLTLAGEVPAPNMIDDVIAAVRAVRGVRSVRSAIRAETFRRPYGDFPDWGYHPYPFGRP